MTQPEFPKAYRKDTEAKMRGAIARFIEEYDWPARLPGVDRLLIRACIARLTTPYRLLDRGPELRYSLPVPTEPDPQPVKPAAVRKRRPTGSDAPTWMLLNVQQHAIERYAQQHGIRGSEQAVRNAIWNGVQAAPAVVGGWCGRRQSSSGDTSYVVDLTGAGVFAIRLASVPVVVTYLRLGIEATEQAKRLVASAR